MKITHKHFLSIVKVFTLTSQANNVVFLKRAVVFWEVEYQNNMADQNKPSHDALQKF